MSQIIYRKAAFSPWIKQGDRLTKTFASGLCLIQQTYIAPKALATYDAFNEGDAITDAQPCIDGAYIFPAPDYQDTGDGFIKCTVTAYGRVNTTGNKTFSKGLGEQGFYAVFISAVPIDPSLGGDRGTTNYSVEVTTDFLVWKFVSAKNASPNVTISDDLKIYRLTGEELKSVQFSEFFSTVFLAGINKPTKADFTTPKKITRAENVNYGFFDEWTVAYKAQPTNVSLGEWQHTIPPGPKEDYDPIIPVAQFPTRFELNRPISTNGAARLTLESVENIDSPSFDWLQNFTGQPRTSIPLNNQSVSTYLGGQVRVESEGLYYTPLEINFYRPEPIRINREVTPEGPDRITNGEFTFERYLFSQVGEQNVFAWRLVSIHECFVVTYKNENNQSGHYNIGIIFSDPE